MRKPYLWVFLVIGAAWVLHILFINPAFGHTLVAYVGTLKRFSIIMSVVLGYLIFHETEFKKRLWAAVLIVIGALLISMDDLPTRISTKIEWLGL